MGEALKAEVIVGKNGEVVVRVDPDKFPEGTRLSLVANTISGVEPPKKNFLDFLGTAKGLFSSREEVDEFIRQERESFEERIQEIGDLQQ